MSQKKFTIGGFFKHEYESAKHAVGNMVHHSSKDKHKDTGDESSMTDDASKFTNNYGSVEDSKSTLLNKSEATSAKSWKSRFSFGLPKFRNPISSYFENQLNKMTGGILDRGSIGSIMQYANEGPWSWRLCGFVAGLSIMALSGLSLYAHFLNLEPINLIMDVYLFILGFVSTFIELRNNCCTKRCIKTLKTEALFLYRPYGRAAFYFFVGILMISYQGLLGKALGIYVSFVGLVIFFASRAAFSHIASMKSQLHTKEDLIAKFKEFDRDNSGTLSSKELAALCKALGSALTLNELESAIFILDKDGNGVIELSEFVDWWEGKDESV